MHSMKAQETVALFYLFLSCALTFPRKHFGQIVRSNHQDAGSIFFFIRLGRGVKAQMKGSIKITKHI